MLRRAARLALALSFGGCSLLLNEGEFSGGRGPAMDGAPEDAVTTFDAAVAPDIVAEGGSVDADASSSPYASAVLADGPLLYLRFGDTSGTTANATVGRDGTYATAGITLGAPGALAGDPDTAVTLTDGSGRITVPSGFAFDGRKPFSVELWAKPSPATTGLGFIVDHTDYVGDRRGWSVFVGKEGVAFERWYSEGVPRSVRETALATGIWHHVVATFDGTTSRLYSDGVRLGQIQADLELPSRVSTLTIGNQSCDCGSGNAYVGEIDELAIYDKALTEMQIAAHLAAAK